MVAAGHCRCLDARAMRIRCPKPRNRSCTPLGTAMSWSSAVSDGSLLSVWQLSCSFRHGDKQRGAHTHLLKKACCGCGFIHR